MIEDENDLNISDVLAVIENTDPSFSAIADTEMANTMTGGVTLAGNQQSATTTNRNSYSNAHVVIVEQPASKAMRFRYECEGRSAGSIPGEHSAPENKTYPTIKVVGYKGKAVVVVSCVTKDQPYRPHPHNLVGKEGCRRGVCTVEIPSESMTVSFSNLGIRCVKKKDIEEALRVREEIRVDPFHTKFGHRNQPASIDLNAIRLCFQVFLESGGKFSIPLPPIVSQPIYDKKAMSDLHIIQLSHTSSSVAGGQKVLLFCEKITKEDISVRFYEEKDNQLIWEDFAEFQPGDVHRQVGIAFTTPRYRTLEVKDEINANIQLVRPSDKAQSDPLRFTFTPLEQEGDPKRKRLRVGTESPKTLYRVQQVQEIATKSCSPSFGGIISLEPPVIKVEPRENQNKTYGGGLSPYSPANIGPERLMQYRVPPLSVSPGTCAASPMDYNENSYGGQFHLSPQQMPIYQNSPNHDQQSLDGMVAQNTQDPDQWNLTIKTDIFDQSWKMNIAANPQFEQDPNWNTFNQVTVPVNTVPDTNVVMNNLDDPPGISSVFDLDSQELQQLNSTDLANNLSVFDNQLSERTSNLNIVDDGAQNNNEQSENMTDSLTRIANSAINEICNLNNFCKPEKK